MTNMSDSYGSGSSRTLAEPGDIEQWVAARPHGDEAACLDDGMSPPRVDGTGILVSVLCAGLTAVAVYSFGAAVAEVATWLAWVVNIVAVAGIAPTLWRWRALPVWRWVVYGLVGGLVPGWLGLMIAFS